MFYKTNFLCSLRKRRSTYDAPMTTINDGLHVLKEFALSRVVTFSEVITSFMFFKIDFEKIAFVNFILFKIDFNLSCSLKLISICETVYVPVQIHSHKIELNNKFNSKIYFWIQKL